jgi:hypothetical protein
MANAGIKAKTIYIFTVDTSKKQKTEMIMFQIEKSLFRTILKIL